MSTTLLHLGMSSTGGAVVVVVVVVMVPFDAPISWFVVCRGRHDNDDDGGAAAGASKPLLLLWVADGDKASTRSMAWFMARILSRMDSFEAAPLLVVSGMVLMGQGDAGMTRLYEGTRITDNSNEKPLSLSQSLLSAVCLGCASLCVCVCERERGHFIRRSLLALMSMMMATTATVSRSFFDVYVSDSVVPRLHTHKEREREQGRGRISVDSTSNTDEKVGNRPIKQVPFLPFSLKSVMCLSWFARLIFQSAIPVAPLLFPHE